jgi:uncharacterized membrane protein YfcA
MGLSDPDVELPILLVLLAVAVAGYVIGAVLWYRRGFLVIKNAIRDFLLMMLFATPGFVLLGFIRGLTRSDFLHGSDWMISFILPFLGFWLLERRKQTQSKERIAVTPS